MGPLSVYVHLPWCKRKCHYCDFNSRPGSEEQRARYRDALMTEIDRRAETFGGSCVRTIFFGGGTPTVYEAGELAGILTALTAASIPGRDATATSPPAPLSAPEKGSKVTARGSSGVGGAGAVRRAAQTAGLPDEITCEANPETVDLPKLRELRDAGFNRISIGAQSFDDEELTMLGRGHSVRQIAEAVEAAYAAGFENVSMDLIYALPGQTVESWRETLLQALALHPEHLSAYGLELAEGTPLFDRWRRGEIEPVGESEHLAMREITRELCAQAGLERYEISNYARPGRECAHNITYWRNAPYLGLGAGAWSYLGGVRSGNLREPIDYVHAIEAAEESTAYEERLDPDDALTEALMMGLRMVEGLEVAALERSFGNERVRDLIARAEPLVEMGFLDLSGGWLRLTAEGEPLHTQVCVRLA